jgi:hypothetical protein
VSELGPPEYQKQDAIARPLTISVKLGKKHAVYDQRNDELLGKLDVVNLDLPPYEPSLISILPEPIQSFIAEGAEQVKRGELIKLQLALKGPTLGETHTFRVRVNGPDGEMLPVLTQTLVAPSGQAIWEVPFALSDPVGQYILEAKDVATGVSVRHELTVED